MEAHIISIVRFAICVLALTIAIIAMVKADDNNAMRRIFAFFSAILIYFNKQIGHITYLVIGSTIEMLVTTAGVGFVLVLAAVLLFLPLIIVIRWLTH